MWQWLYKLGSPKWFYDLGNRSLPWLWGVTLFLLIIGVIWGLAFAPPDYQMGDNYRIIYMHVPAAGLMKGCFYMMALCSAAVLIWKVKMADIVAKAIAPIGTMATLLMLASGSLWGIPTWGTWWIWDARLTSSLLQFFIYMGIIVLRSAFDSQDTAARACAVLTLVGVVNIPIIEYSVEWWNTLHQGASSLGMRDTSANPPEIWIPAFFTGFGFIGLFFIGLILRSQNEILWRERRTQWVRDIVTDTVDHGAADA
ncbi:MAG: heme ABC transporter permease CcmC [Pseudohongiellaceae bacterium]|jgi:heme exporter protein C